MPKKVLKPKSLSYLPLPLYPYSAGTMANGLIYTAGLVAWDENNKLVGHGDAAAQTRQCLKNIESVIREAGGSKDDIMKCNVYLADIRYFPDMTEEFRKFFPKDPPARTTVQAPMAEREILVEIEAIAFVGKLER